MTMSLGRKRTGTQASDHPVIIASTHTSWQRSGSDRPIVGISQLRRSLSMVLYARPLGDGLLKTERHTYPQLPALLALCATHTLSWRNQVLNIELKKSESLNMLRTGSGESYLAAEQLEPRRVFIF